MLNNQIIFFNCVETQNGNGEIVKSWIEFCSRSCDIDTSAKVEESKHSVLLGQSIYRIKIRYDSVTKNITEKMRATINGLIFTIDAPPVNVEMKNKYLDLVCSRYSNAR